MNAPDTNQRWGSLTSLYNTLTKLMGAEKMRDEPKMFGVKHDGHPSGINLSQAIKKQDDYAKLIDILDATLNLGWNDEKKTLAAMIRTVLHNTERFVGVDEIPDGMGGNSGTHPLFSIAQYARVLGKSALSPEAREKELRSMAVPILVHDDGELIEYGTVNDNALGTGKDVDTLERMSAEVLYKLAASFASQGRIEDFYQTVLPVQQSLMEVQHASRQKMKVSALSSAAYALFDAEYLSERARKLGVPLEDVVILKSDLPHVFERAIHLLNERADKQIPATGEWQRAASEFSNANEEVIHDKGLLKQKVYQIETIEGTRHMLRMYTEQLFGEREKGQPVTRQLLSAPYRAEITPSFFVTNQHNRNLAKASDLFEQAVTLPDSAEKTEQLTIAKALFIEQLRVTQRYTAYRDVVWDRTATKETEPMISKPEFLSERSAGLAEVASIHEEGPARAAALTSFHRAPVCREGTKEAIARHTEMRNFYHALHVDTARGLLPIETKLRQVTILEAAIDAVKDGTWVPTNAQCHFFGQLGTLQQTNALIELPGDIQTRLKLEGGRRYQRKAMQQLHRIYTTDLGDAAKDMLPQGYLSVLEKGGLRAA